MSVYVCVLRLSTNYSLQGLLNEREKMHKRLSAIIELLTTSICDILFSGVVNWGEFLINVQVKFIPWASRIPWMFSLSIFFLIKSIKEWLGCDVRVVHLLNQAIKYQTYYRQLEADNRACAERIFDGLISSNNGNSNCLLICDWFINWHPLQQSQHVCAVNDSLATLKLSIS